MRGTTESILERVDALEQRLETAERGLRLWRGLAGLLVLVGFALLSMSTGAASRARQPVSPGSYDDLERRVEDLQRQFAARRPQIEAANRLTQHIRIINGQPYIDDLEVARLAVLDEENIGTLDRPDRSGKLMINSPYGQLIARQDGNRISLTITNGEIVVPDVYVGESRTIHLHEDPDSQRGHIDVASGEIHCNQLLIGKEPGAVDRVVFDANRRQYTFDGDLHVTGRVIADQRAFSGP